MSFKNIPKALQGEEVTTFSDLNLPFTEGVAASYSAVQAENTVSRQREIAGEIIDKNIDTERLASNGISREDLIDHIQSPHFQGISTRGTQKAVKDTRIGNLSGDAAEAIVTITVGGSGGGADNGTGSAGTANQGFNGGNSSGSPASGGGGAGAIWNTNSPTNYQYNIKGGDGGSGIVMIRYKL